METKTNGMTFGKVMTIVAVVGGLYIGYQSLVVVPANAVKAAQDKLMLETAEKMVMEQGFENCAQEVQKGYVSSWNLRCDNIGKEANCTLPNYLSSGLDASRSQDLVNCRTFYPSK